MSMSELKPKFGRWHTLGRACASALCFNLLLMTSSLSAQTLRLDQDAADALAALDDTITLRFLDALTGEGIPGALVRFEGRTKTTDAEGAVKFSEPEGLSEDEVRKAHFEHPKYVRTSADVRFLLGKVFFNRYSISPALPPGKIRVVLDWLKSPADLDAHLERKGVYHLSFRDMVKYQDKAWLDRDDRDGFGPETISVMKLDASGHYTYSVHDYTNRASSDSVGLRQSRAHVRVYSDSGLIKTFVVPEGKGTLWRVFEVKGGLIQPVNTLTYPR